MTLDEFNVSEIQRRLDKISTIVKMDMSFEKILRLHNELFVLKAIVDNWEFNTELKTKDYEGKPYYEEKS